MNIRFCNTSFCNTYFCHTSCSILCHRDIVTKQMRLWKHGAVPWHVSAGVDTSPLCNKCLGEGPCGASKEPWVKLFSFQACTCIHWLQQSYGDEGTIDWSVAMLELDPGVIKWSYYSSRHHQGHPLHHGWRILWTRHTEEDCKLQSSIPVNNFSLEPGIRKIEVQQKAKGQEGEASIKTIGNKADRRASCWIHLYEEEEKITSWTRHQEDWRIKEARPKERRHLRRNPTRLKVKKKEGPCGGSKKPWVKVVSFQACTCIYWLQLRYGDGSATRAWEKGLVVQAKSLGSRLLEACPILCHRDIVMLSPLAVWHVTHCIMDEEYLEQGIQKRIANCSPAFL